jgi:hypothetical protein
MSVSELQKKIDEQKRTPPMPTTEALTPPVPKVEAVVTPPPPNIPTDPPVEPYYPDQTAHIKRTGPIDNFTTTIVEEPSEPLPKSTKEKECESKACNFYRNAMPYVNVAFHIALVLVILAGVFVLIQTARKVGMPVPVPA